MSVYVGPSIYPFGRMIMCHMVADSLEELHDMADKLGIARYHFQKGNGKPHYDICKSKRILAIEYGAKSVDERTIIKVLVPFRWVYL